MNELPLGWKIIPLSQAILEIRNGISAKPDNASGLPILRISAVRPMRLDIDDVRFLPHDFPVTKYRLQTGDLLFTRYNGNREFVGVCARVRQVFRETVYPDKLIRVRVNLDVALPEFVEGAVHAGLSRSFIEEKLKTSAGQVGISGADLLSVPMPLPPLAEQKRIADKLDRLLARVDACRERLDRVPALLKRFRQSVLAAATSGELTREWRESSENRPDWQWKQLPLGDLILNGPKNGIYKNATAYGAGTRILRIDNFYDGFTNPWEDLKRLEVTAKEQKDYGLEIGDIVVNRVNSLSHLGKAALIRDLPEACVFESNMMRIRLDTARIRPQYAILVLTSPAGINQLRSNAKHAVNQASINQTDICSVHVPLPSLAEQTEIISRVDTLFNLESALTERLSSSLVLAERINPATLAKAFRGELVPQDPTDESAAALLARVAASQAAESPSKVGLERVRKLNQRKL